MLKKLKWLFKEWLTQKKQIALMTEHIHILNTRFKYLQERLDRMEVPR